MWRWRRTKALAMPVFTRWERRARSAGRDASQDGQRREEYSFL
jgi:hypothetical protein